MGEERSRVLASAGENEARAYAAVVVPPSRPPPPLEAERVVLVDPRETETLTGPPPNSGPRNQAQMVWTGPKPPGVELPDGLPIWKAQRIRIDPELLAQWDREEAERKAREAEEKKREE